jgi:hypothetical protein
MKHIICILLLCAAAFAQGIGGAAGIGGTAGIGGGATLGPQTYSVDTTGLSANVSATNVTGLSSISAAGFYCATGFEVVTTTGSGTDVLPQINFIFTDSDTSTVETQNIANSDSGTALSSGTVNGTYNTSLTGANPMCGYAKSGTAIQYSTSGCSTNCGTSLVYALHVRVFGPITSGQVDTTGLTGNVSATNVPGLSAISGNGFYCARDYEVITTSVATTTELPTLYINYTDADSGTSESTPINAGLVASPGAVGSTNGVYGPPTIHGFCFYAQSGTAIQYQYSNYISTPGGMTYSAHLRVVGPISVNPVDVTGQTASISATNVPGMSSLSANGYYCAVGYGVITTAATTSSTIPYLQVLFTPADAGSAVTDWIASDNSGNAVGTTVGTLNSSPVTSSFCFYAKSGTAIQYATNSYASSGATSMAYAVHFRIIGPTQF